MTNKFSLKPVALAALALASLLTATHVQATIGTVVAGGHRPILMFEWYGNWY
jgi:hypothetical protein